LGEKKTCTGGHGSMGRQVTANSGRDRGNLIFAFCLFYFRKQGFRFRPVWKGALPKASLRPGKRNARNRLYASAVPSIAASMADWDDKTSAFPSGLNTGLSGARHIFYNGLRTELLTRPPTFWTHGLAGVGGGGKVVGHWPAVK